MKFKKIQYRDGRSLKDLDLSFGNFVSFDINEDIPQPVILLRVGGKGLTKIFNHPGANPTTKENEVYLIHPRERGKLDYWNLESQWNILALWSPTGEGLKRSIPNLADKPNLYVFESAYVNEEIIKAFEQEKNGLFEFKNYVPWLRSEFEKAKNRR